MQLQSGGRGGAALLPHNESRDQNERLALVLCPPTMETELR